MQDATEIARSLTEAQRRALCKISIDPTRVSTVASLHGLHTFRALERRELVTARMYAMISCVRLTPLGLAVRAALERTTHDQ